MDSRKTEIQEVVERAKKDGIEWVSLQSVDIDGKIKSEEIPVRDLEDSLKRGKYYDGSSIAGFVRIEESDMLLLPDPSTYAPVPWSSSGKKARLICDVFWRKGKPFEGCPRRVLKSNIDAMKQFLGENVDFFVAPEAEFYILREEGGDYKTPDDAGYFDLEFDDFRTECANILEKMGIVVEACHHEVGPGQHEIDIAYNDGLKIADQTTTYKEVVKQVAKKYGFIASFMPKPFGNKAGSGMHTHINLKRTGKNLFFNGKRKRGKRKHLSDTALYFMGGLMEHARATSSILSSTPNSYKRLGVSEAPNYVVWTHRNRSAFIRIPEVREREYDSIRIELRSPDPACNPYLAFAVMLAAGMDGIKRRTDPGDPRDENIQRMSTYEGINKLPDSLGEALSYLEADDVISSALGSHCLNEFLRLKRAEWEDYRTRVGSEERKHYIDL